MDLLFVTPSGSQITPSESAKHTAAAAARLKIQTISVTERNIFLNVVEQFKKEDKMQPQMITDDANTTAHPPSDYLSLYI